MLVLTRVPEETITLIINEGSENEIRALLTVVRIERNKVRLGFDAPSNIKIIRTEIIKDKSLAGNK